MVIDVRSEAQFNRTTDEELSRLRSNYATEVLSNEIVAGRIRGQCYDGFETKSLRIFPLSTDESELNPSRGSYLSSFPIRRLSKE